MSSRGSSRRTSSRNRRRKPAVGTPGSAPTAATESGTASPHQVAGAAPHDGPPAAAASPAVPREVRWAGLALWVVATLYAISALLAVLTASARADDLREIETTLTDAEIDRAVTLGIAISVVFSLAIAGVAVLSAVNATRGRRWARVTATVAAGIAGAFSLLRIVGGGPTAVIGLVVLLAAAAAIVLLYRPPAARFFAKSDTLDPHP